MQLAGYSPIPLEEAFCCILPGHEEKRPSAAWCRSVDGRLLYHDFHRPDASEWWTLGEVFHAISTGQAVQLDSVRKAQSLARLALSMGHKSPLVLEQEQKIAALTLCLPSDFPPIAMAAFGTVTEHVLVEAMSGYLDAKASARFLAERGGLALNMVNRAVNLLCCLGIIQKSPGSGGMRGDRLSLGSATPDSANVAWERMGRPTLIKLNRHLVERTIGYEVASRIFRQQGSARRDLTQEVNSDENR